MDDDHDDPLSRRQHALLEGLRGVEAGGGFVDVAALAAATGYSESSIRTYFTKRLEGVLVFREEQGWRVRGAARCTPEEFARRMSQKAGAAGDALRSEEAWRALLRKLLYEGQRRRYALSREELDLVRSLPIAPVVSPTAGRDGRDPAPADPAPTLPLPLFRGPGPTGGRSR